MSSDTEADNLLTALLKEICKTKTMYDGSNRITIRYEAFANAANGAKCLRTDYTYVGASVYVDASKESIGAWDSSWDI